MGWVKVEFLLNELIIVITIYLDNKLILWRRFVVNPNFLKRFQAIKGNSQRKKRLVKALILLGCDNIFADLQFGKFCYLIVKYGHSNMLTIPY